MSPASFTQVFLKLCRWDLWSTFDNIRDNCSMPNCHRYVAKVGAHFSGVVLHPLMSSTLWLGRYASSAFAPYPSSTPQEWYFGRGMLLFACKCMYSGLSRAAGPGPRNIFSYTPEAAGPAAPGFCFFMML